MCNSHETALELWLELCEQRAHPDKGYDAGERKTSQGSLRFNAKGSRQMKKRLPGSAIAKPESL